MTDFQRAIAAIIVEELVEGKEIDDIANNAAKRITNMFIDMFDKAVKAATP